jgi:hypothetical protein
VDGRRLGVSDPLVAGPFLAHLGAGQWMFSFGTRQIRFAALP